MQPINNQVIDEIKKGKKWCFCDYYDTLVERDCHPEDIKGFWASEMASIFNYVISESSVLLVRVAAEKALSEKYSGLVSFSYDYHQLCREIYNRLLCINQDVVMKKYVSYDLFFEESFRIETEIEKRHQTIIKSRIELLKRIKQLGVNIAIVSDFYIGKDGFKIYASDEIASLIDRIFISCDYGLRKDTGKLYDYVLCSLHIKPQDVVMIGDNRRSDKYIPERMGIRSFIIKKRYVKQNTIKEQEKRLWNLMKRNTRKPYINYAFSLYFYIDGLYRYLRVCGAQTVLFCAREGEFLRELFNLYINEKGCNSIHNEYFYVSRLSSFVPSLKDIEEEQFKNLFRQYRDVSPKSFMLSIGFSEKEALEVCEKNNILSENIIKNFNKSDEYRKIKNSEIFLQYYKEKISTQRKNFRGYLDTLCIPESELYIVDVGWKGTIQDNIYNVYDGKRKITGIYLGLNENLQFSTNNSKVGINFSTYPSTSAGVEIWSYDKSFYEKLLYASHASTTGYGNDLMPILENFANEKATYEYVRPVQLDIIEVFKCISTIMNASYCSAADLKDIYTKIHLYTICHIGKRHLKMQNKLVENHFQNFGEFSWSQKKVVRQIGEIFLSNPNEILRKIWKDGLDIKFMYPGIKVLQKYKCKALIGLYTRLVYLRMIGRVNGG